MRTNADHVDFIRHNQCQDFLQDHHDVSVPPQPASSIFIINIIVNKAVAYRCVKNSILFLLTLPRSHVWQQTCSIANNP